MRGLSPQTEDGLLDRVGQTLDRRLDSGASAPLAVGFSGGGDSRALLGLLAAWALPRRRRVLAVTVDHGLQPHSGRWSRAAEAAARALGCDWSGVAWTGLKPATGTAAAARAARHRLLANAARQAGAAVLLLGHTYDDRLESAVIRRFDPPGPGELKEWSPSPAWPEGRGVFCLRPLLNERRLTLRRHLLAEGAEWLEDPANGDLRQARARARKRLAEGEPPSLSGSDSAARDQANLGELLLASPAGSLEGNLAELRDLPAPARRRLVAFASTCAGGAAAPPSGAACEQLSALISAGRPFIRSLNGARVEACADRVVFRREAGEFRRKGSTPPLALKPGEVFVWDGRFLLQSAEPVHAAPLDGRRKALSPADLRLARQISAADRPSLPVFLGPRGAALPAPFGAAAGRAVSLVGLRFLAAAGAARCEQEISRIFLADRPHSSYVDALAPA